MLNTKYIVRKDQNLIDIAVTNYGSEWVRGLEMIIEHNDVNMYGVLEPGTLLEIKSVNQSDLTLQFLNTRSINVVTGPYLLPVPEAPSNLVVILSEVNESTLTWSDLSENESNFILQRSTSLDFSTDLTSISISFNTESYVDSGLPYATTYYYRINAVGPSGGESNWSNIATVTTPYEPYNFQNGLRFDGVNDRWINSGGSIRPTYEVYYAATFIYWFRVTQNFSGTAGLFYFGLGTGSNQINGSISGDGAGNGNILIRNGYTGQPAFDYAENIPLEIGKKHMVAITFSGYDNDGEARVYFDGVKVAEDLAVPPAIKNMNTSHFSSNGGTATYHIPGVVGEMRIIGAMTSGSNATPSSGESAVLSEAEIAKIYNQGYGNDEVYDKFNPADFRWLMKFNSNAHGSPETGLYVANEGGTPNPGNIVGSNFAAPIDNNYFETF